MRFISQDGLFDNSTITSAHLVVDDLAVGGELAVLVTVIRAGAVATVRVHHRVGAVLPKVSAIPVVRTLPSTTLELWGRHEY